MTTDKTGPSLSPRHDLSEKEALERLASRRARPALPPARQLASRVQKITHAFLKDEGPGISQIEARWRDLVGDRLAKISVPTRLTKSKHGTILHLDIVPAAAPLFQHQSEALCSKISVLIGSPVKALKLNQKSGPNAATTAKSPLRILSLDETRALQNEVSDVRSDRLRDALLKFGQSIRQRQPE